MDTGVVHSVSQRTVAVHKTEAFGEFLLVNHQGIFETHLLEQLFGGFFGLRARGHRQGETQLHLAVVHRVAIWLYLGEVEGFVVILRLHRIQSFAHFISFLSLIQQTG